MVSRAYLPTGTVCRGEARGMDTVCKSVAVGRGHARVVARVPENTCGTTKVCSSRHLPMHRVPAGCRGLSRGAGALGVGVQRGVDMPERCSGARPRERAGAARKFGPRVRRPAGPGSVQKDGDGPSPSFGYFPEVRSDLRDREWLGAESGPARVRVRSGKELWPSSEAAGWPGQCSERWGRAVPIFWILPRGQERSP